MEDKGYTRGIASLCIASLCIASLCIGGGMGIAMAIERA